MECRTLPRIFLNILFPPRGLFQPFLARPYSVVTLCYGYSYLLVSQVYDISHINADYIAGKRYNCPKGGIVETLPALIKIIKERLHSMFLHRSISQTERAEWTVDTSD